MTLNPNQLTIQAYNSQVATYIEHTPDYYDDSRQSLKQWITDALSYINPNGSILEIGSATPRDARFMRHQGFNVQCSDATPNFVQHLRDSGENALLLDITHDQIPKTYDMVFANAVFPHFTPEDTTTALQTIRKGLNEGGVLAFNVKQGEGMEWINEKLNDKRYIHYWQPHEIYDLVKSYGYEILQLEDGIEGERPTHIWTRIIAQKITN